MDDDRVHDVRVGANEEEKKVEELTKDEDASGGGAAEMAGRALHEALHEDLATRLPLVQRAFLGLLLDRRQTDLAREVAATGLAVTANVAGLLDALRDATAAAPAPATALEPDVDHDAAEAENEAESEYDAGGDGADVGGVSGDVTCDAEGRRRNGPKLRRPDLRRQDGRHREACLGGAGGGAGVIVAASALRAGLLEGLVAAFQRSKPAPLWPRRDGAAGSDGWGAAVGAAAAGAPAAAAAVPETAAEGGGGDDDEDDRAAVLNREEIAVDDVVSQQV